MHFKVMCCAVSAVYAEITTSVCGMGARRPLVGETGKTSTLNMCLTGLRLENTTLISTCNTRNCASPVYLKTYTGTASYVVHMSAA